MIAACQHRCVDFRLFVEGYYTTQSYYDTWASLFHPIFNEDEWPLYGGPTIVPLDSLQRTGSGRPRSTRLHKSLESFAWLKYATKKENSHASTHEPMHLPLTAKAAAWYQDAAACLMLLMLLKCDIM